MFGYVFRFLIPFKTIKSQLLIFTAGDSVLKHLHFLGYVFRQGFNFM